MNTTKKKTHVFLGMGMAMAMLSLTACSSDDLAPQTKETISLATSLDGMRGTNNLQTTQLHSKVKVGVFGLAGTTILENGNNSQYTVSGSTLTAVGSAMEWPKGSASLYAYAPYQTGWSYNQANAFTVATDQSTDDGYLASDLVYGVPATNPVSQTTDAVVLNFKHVMARLTIKIQNETDIDLSGAQLVVANTKVSTTLTPSTGAIGSATGDAADITVLATLGTATTAYAVLVPQTITAGTVLIRLTTIDKVLEVKLTDDITLASGKSYTFTAHIGSDAINSQVGEDNATTPANSRTF